ncbi:antiviral reverse transcriptase Drt3a [Bradyrhizobium stylosanthis]|uniref:antiviral reverse transcriptase Drt3a n=1 Tax=Bradyrhizobium stylosanthis TaxID=1803665 RepID=UPI000AD1AFE5|nr:antiviral reverse transcriptase Drt3a [Bradyrhizobium stylosanthis]
MLSGLNKDLLSRCITSTDLQNPDILANPCDEEGLVQRAELVIKFGFASLNIEPISIRGNTAHCIRSTPHTLVLRGLNQILRKTANIQPSDRDTIIRRLITILGEGVQHRVYKFDIRSFFESLDAGLLLKELWLVPAIPRNAVTTLANYFQELHDRGISGLPRGVQLSATLSEFALRQFDREISLLPDVYFHARYVDDIIIITGARENANDFTRSVRDLLPYGLKFNNEKTKRIDLPAFTKGQANGLVGQFDYLGYSFLMHPVERSSTDNRFHRKVGVTIADKKVRRIKSRICLAVCQYLQDSDSVALEQRLQLLTGNHNLQDFSTGRSRNVGLWSNYRRVNSFEALAQLDSFLRSVLVGNKSHIADRFALSRSYQGAAIPAALRVRG